jgi:hypothetical protein
MPRTFEVPQRFAEINVVYISGTTLTELVFDIRHVSAREINTNLAHGISEIMRVWVITYQQQS